MKSITTQMKKFIIPALVVVGLLGLAIGALAQSGGIKPFLNESGLQTKHGSIVISDNPSTDPSVGILDDLKLYIDSSATDGLDYASFNEIRVSGKSFIASDSENPVRARFGSSSLNNIAMATVEGNILGTDYTDIGNLDQFRYLCADPDGKVELCQMGGGGCTNFPGSHASQPANAGNGCTGGFVYTDEADTSSQWQWRCADSTGTPSYVCSAEKEGYSWNVGEWGECSGSSTTSGICQGQSSIPSSCSGPAFTGSSCFHSYYPPGVSGINGYKVEILPGTSCATVPQGAHYNYQATADYSQLNCTSKNEAQCNVSGNGCTWAFNGHTPNIPTGGEPGTFTEGCLPSASVEYIGSGTIHSSDPNLVAAGDNPMPFGGAGYYPKFQQYFVNPSCAILTGQENCSASGTGCTWTPEENVFCGDQVSQPSCLAENSICTWIPAANSTGQQNREVTCQDSGGNTVPNSFCPPPQPTETQSCGGNSNSVPESNWQVGPWGECEPIAGGNGDQGTQTRSIFCPIGSVCPLQQPASSQSCTVDPLGQDGKVICTELHRQGFIPDEHIIADNEYGTQNVDPKTLALYHVWAKPLVTLMQGSTFVTEVVKPYGVAWAHHMAYLKDASETDSYLGRMLHNTFLPIHDFLTGGESDDIDTEEVAAFDTNEFILYVALVLFTLGVVAIALLPIVLILAYSTQKGEGLKKVGNTYIYFIGVMIVLLAVAYLF